MSKKLISKIMRRFGYDIRAIRNVIPYATEDQRRIIDICRPYTQTTQENSFALIRATEYLVRNAIPGAFVECGVWKGGSVMAMIMELDLLGDSRDIYLFDTFCGMPQADNVDVDLKGRHEQWYRRGGVPSAGQGSEWNAISVEEVQKNVGSLSSARQRLHFIKGRVEESLPAQAPESIALLRLDTDFYASTKHELEHLYPRLVKGGVLIIDDYGHFLGARQAVDEYFRTRDVKMLMNRIDYTAIIGIKS